jgi:hypothetical protein
VNDCIANYARVIKTISSLLKKKIVHLYYVKLGENDINLFNDKVKLSFAVSPYNNWGKTTC